MANLSDLTPYFLKSNYLLTRVARTSNTILAATDKGKWFDATSGTWTQTLTAAATLGAGWWCWLGNSGTGEVTLDPNGSELIDGLANYIVYPGEVRLIVCTGSAFETIILQGFRYAYTASGTFTKPPGYHSFDCEIWSAGGSGGQAPGGGNATGGGGGGYWRDTIAATVFGVTEAVTVGTGGAAQGTAGAAGSAGGDSTFVGMTPSGGGGGAIANTGGSVTSATGGKSLATVASTMLGFYSSNPNNIYGGSGSGAVDASDNAAAGGSTVQGGAAGGSIGQASGVAAAGTSLRGGAGGAANASGAGVAGTAPGGGGGASRGGSSGAGARGEVRIVGVF